MSTTYILLYTTAHPFLWLAVCVYNYVRFKVSTKSFASCLVAIDSLGDDRLISNEAKTTFLGRMLSIFGLSQDDADIRVLKKELKELLCHNTDLKG